MKRLSVNVPMDLHREAKVLAHLGDETLSSLILRLLHQYVERQTMEVRRRTGERPKARAVD